MIVSLVFVQIFFAKWPRSNIEYCTRGQTGSYFSVCFVLRSTLQFDKHIFFSPLSLFYRHSQDKIRGETHQSPWLLSDKLFIWRVSCLVSLVSSSSALLIWNIALHNEGEK